MNYLGGMNQGDKDVSPKSPVNPLGTVILFIPTTAQAQGLSGFTLCYVLDLKSLQRLFDG